MFDPRARLWAALAMILATLCADTWLEIGGLAGLLTLTLALVKMPPARIGRNLLLVTWLALFTLGAHLIGEHRAAQALRQGLNAGGLAAARLVLLVGWGTVLGHSSSPLALVAALERALSPLTRIGAPVASLSLVAMLSLRFLPILVQEQQILMRTHSARGIDIMREPLRARLKFLVMLGAPLLGHLFRRVEHLSAAMESRGFQAQAPRTTLMPMRLRGRDYALLCGCALLSGAIIMTSFMLKGK